MIELTQDERDLLADVWDEDETVSAGAFYPVVARMIEARLHAERKRVGTALLRMATDEFVKKGVDDPRGAAIWDSGTWVREKAAREEWEL